MLHPLKWEETPIVRGKNEVTGMIEGNDDGYGRVDTLKNNPSPLVVPDVLVRAVYDGFDPYTGDLDVSRAMPGGLDGRKLVVREALARDLEDANKLLLKVFGGRYRLAIYDGFRSGPRQRLGFNGVLDYYLLASRLKPDDVDARAADFTVLGKKAHGTFCYLQADLGSPQAVALIDTLRKDSRFMDEMKDCADCIGKTVDEAIALYVTVSANSGLGRATNVPVMFEWNAHAGGGAADVFLVGANGLPINPVPFDYPGPEARMDFLEDDANFEKYVVAARTNELLRKHLERLGLTADTFKRTHWLEMRAALRVWYHLVKAKGWTYYSEEDCGENWHLEGANVCKDVLTGQVFYEENLTSANYPHSGNPGHTLQVLGKQATAVWGGKTAHDLLADQIMN